MTRLLLEALFFDAPIQKIVTTNYLATGSNGRTNEKNIENTGLSIVLSSDRRVKMSGARRIYGQD